MKIPHYLLVFLILYSQSLIVHADQPLSRKLVDSYVLATEKLDALSSKFPEVMAKSDEFSLSQESQLTTYFKASKAYPDIKRILSDTGFSSIKKFISTASRIMGGYFTAQMSKIPSDMQPDSMLKGMEISIKNLKEAGSIDVARMMEEQLNGFKKDIKETSFMMERASSQDKVFARDNFIWLQQRLDYDAEEN